MGGGRLISAGEDSEGHKSQVSRFQDKQEMWVKLKHGPVTLEALTNTVLDGTQLEVEHSSFLP